jgi:hypothetical protein
MYEATNKTPKNPDNASFPSHIKEPHLLDDFKDRRNLLLKDKILQHNISKSPF